MQSNINILHDWLHRRGITQNVMDMFGITTYDHKDIGECIKIPISSTHSKYRRHPLDERKPKYLYDAGGKVTLYGLSHLTTEHTTVLITEGEADCLVAWSHNIPAVTSTGGAMSFQAEWAELLQGYDVTLCFDNDDAGAEGMVRVLKYLPHAKIALIPEQPDVKDISDYVARGGDLHALLATARHYATTTEVEQDMADRQAHWQPVRFHRKYLEDARQQHERANKPQSTTYTYEGTDPKLRARTYPMGKLIDFKHHKVCCLWHNENTGSLHYYPETNTAYCWGSCGRSFDVIDVYMKQNNVPFLRAVDELNKMV